MGYLLQKKPTVISKMSTEVNSHQIGKIWNNNTKIWQNIALRRVPKIASNVLFSYLPSHEPFVVIRIERPDFLFDTFSNNGLSSLSPPDEFLSPLYLFPVIKQELLFFLKVYKSPFISSHANWDFVDEVNKSVRKDISSIRIYNLTDLGNDVHAQRVILVTNKHLPQKLNIHDILLILLFFSFKIGLDWKEIPLMSSPQEVSE